MHLTRQQLAQDASVQSERQQRAASDALRHRLNWRLSLPDESPRFSHNHVLAWKGSTFAAQLARRRFLLATADPATQKLAVELRDITGSLALLRDRQDDASRQRAVELAQQKQDLEVQLAQLSADFRLALKPPTSEQLRAGLPVGTALLDFLVHNGYDPAKPLKGQDGQRRLIVWVVRKDAGTVRLDLGPMGPIEGDIEAWRRAIDKGSDAPAVAARLRQRLWEPLEKHLAGAKLVLLSPDEALGRLPFAALPGREEGKYLLEEVPLALLPVPQVLERVLERPTSKPSLLTLGGVDYGEGKVWSALPGTIAEMKAVEERFRALFKGEMTTLSGTRASKPAVRDALPRHRFAHLATHGYFAPASMRSFLDRDDKAPRDLFGREGVTGWDPALLSGLVFAGANRPPRPGEDDGLLTASEVAEMNLSGVELAVLSACQTGRGKEAGGEGILGLQRAFAVSGCKTTVTSLWSVDDAATSVLMERFYHHVWEKKLPKLEALRQAQLEVMRHPEWVEKRKREMAALAGLRGAGKVAEALVGGKRERRSPVAWWGAWQLAGDWR
jgi:CHAT domain-containing protein